MFASNHDMLKSWMKNVGGYSCRNVLILWCILEMEIRDECYDNAVILLFSIFRGLGVMSAELLVMFYYIWGVYGGLHVCKIPVHLVHAIIQNILVNNTQHLHMSFNLTSLPSAANMRQWTGSSLVQEMACRLFGTKPFSEPMLDSWELCIGNHCHSRKCIWTCRLEMAAILFRPQCGSMW